MPCLLLRYFCLQCLFFASVHMTQRHSLKSGQVVFAALAPWADPPVAKTSPVSPSLLITIYDEYDENMQNNLTVNTSLQEAARRKEGRSYSNVCAEVDDDLRERVRGEEGRRGAAAFRGPRHSQRVSLRTASLMRQPEGLNHLMG